MDYLNWTVEHPWMTLLLGMILVGALGAIFQR